MGKLNIYMKQGQLCQRLRTLLSSSLRAWLISPFVTRQGIDLVLASVDRHCDLRLVCRLNDTDIIAGTVDPLAIADFIEERGNARFSKELLHSKLWIFDKVALVGSANLTGSALSTNYEVMLEVPLDRIDASLEAEFKNIWEHLEQSKKTPEQLRELSMHINNSGKSSRLRKALELPELNDYGLDPSAKLEPTGTVRKKPTKKRQAGWLKINGLSSDRIKEDFNFQQVAPYEGGETVSRKSRGGRPSVQVGEQVVLVRLGLRNGRPDYCIYGRGTVDTAHRRGIDELPGWLKNHVSEGTWNHFQRWPYIFWLRDVQIVNGIAAEAPWIFQLDPSEKIFKRRSFSQKSHLRLNEHQLNTLASSLDAVFEKVPPIVIDRPDGIWWNTMIPNPDHRLNRVRLEVGQ